MAVCWNVNGIKTMKGYHPWYKLPSYEAMLEELGADVACFQETKITRRQVEAGFAVMPKYDAFFNFNVGRGYSGTVIYTKRTVCVPLKAEEGITGRLVEDRDDEDNAIGGYPIDMSFSLSSSDYNRIDEEGRAVVVDLGMFVLFNLYCPNETSPERLPYKMNYYYSVEERVRNLVNHGRQVVIVGDMNICRDRIDHCDPEQSCRDHSLNSFQDHPARRWFDNFLAPKGIMTDMGRRFHPTRKGMYTHWDMKIDGRGTNYGTRLDYVLVTEGLVNWIKDCDIQNQIYGSDHCPVYADFHSSLTDPETGTKQYLKDLLHTGRPWDDDDHGPEPPKLAARFFEEFSSKQRKIATFFARPARTMVAEPTLADAFGALREGPTDTSSHADEPMTNQPSLTGSRKRSDSEESRLATNGSKSVKKVPSPAVTRARTTSGQKTTNYGREDKTQPSLRSFFAAPQSHKPEPEPAALSGAKGGEERHTAENFSYSDLINGAESEVDPADFAWSEVTPQTTAAWDAIFTRKQPPLCSLHQEPAKQWTVNKSGPNHGRKFWLCHRPVGPGYDNGDRPRSEINPQYRCDYFVWDSTVPKGNGAPSPSVSATNSQDQTTPSYKRVKLGKA